MVAYDFLFITVCMFPVCSLELNEVLRQVVSPVRGLPLYVTHPSSL